MLHSVTDREQHGASDCHLGSGDSAQVQRRTSPRAHAGVGGQLCVSREPTAGFEGAGQGPGGEERTLSDAPMFKGVKPLFLVKLLPQLAGTPAKGARWRD